jgi:hypothetical protein
VKGAADKKLDLHGDGNGGFAGIHHDLVSQAISREKQSGYGTDTKLDFLSYEYLLDECAPAWRRRVVCGDELLAAKRAARIHNDGFCFADLAVYRAEIQ